MFSRMVAWLASGLGYLVYGLGALALLLWLLFPVEAMRHRVEQGLNETLSGYEWRVAALDLEIPGGLALRGVEGWDPAERKKPLVRIAKILLQPDLAGVAAHRRLQGTYRLVLGQGEVAGVLRREGRGVWFQGTVKGVLLAELEPLTRPLQRRVEATASGSFEGVLQLPALALPEFHGQLRLENGRLELKSPLLGQGEIPFSQLSTAVQLRDGVVRLDQGRIESPLLEGQFSGEIAWEKSLLNSRVDLRGGLHPKPELFKGVDNQALLQVFRVRLKDQDLPFTISGTLGRPGIHFEEYSMLLQSLVKEQR